MGPVLVFGHRAPDNDSIVSAVAYAHLKNVTDPERIYLPVRLGPVPPETAWVFERFGLDVPEEIAHVRTRVRDAMTAEVITLSADDTVFTAGRLMREHGVRALPVVDRDGTVLGLVNDTILADLYVREIEALRLADLPVTVGQLAKVLDGHVLAGDSGAVLTGQLRIGAMEPETMVAHITPGDVLVVGDRHRTQPRALESGVSCLIVSGGFTPEPAVIELAGELGSAVIVTPCDTYTAVRLIGLGRSVTGIMDTHPLLVDREALLTDVAGDLMESTHREAVVTDGEGRLAGILTRTNLAQGVRRQVVLVDHNESSQSASGIEEAAVLEIVDHHRVGDIQTTAPILFLGLPVGATATVIAERYRQLEAQLPDEIAGVLLSAILTDTVLLKSPTTTDIDRTVAGRLSEQLCIDTLEFGREIFHARADKAAYDAGDIVSSDLKEYRAGSLAAGVAQIEVVDAGEYLERSGELLAALNALRERKGFDIAILLVTDVVAEGSHVFASGKTRIAERALDVHFSGYPVWMPGVLSRKKQVAPCLLEAMGG